MLLRTGAPLTGRQVHSIIGDACSLWSVQESLKALTQLGLVRTQTIGRAGVHTVNDDHVAVPPLRALLDPIAALTEVIRAAIGPEVQGVLLLGSVARGEATVSSDIDLAVIADPRWEGQVHLQDLVEARLGNACDVLAFTATEFDELAEAGEPVVLDILRDGIALVGEKPARRRGAA